MPLNEPARFRRGLVPIWLHVAISMVMSISCFIAALSLAVVVLHRLGLSGQSPRGFAIYALFSVVAVMIPMLVMYKLVPAKCFKCGGRCWAPNPRGNATLKYICENCGRIVDTSMRGGDG